MTITHVMIANVLLAYTLEQSEYTLRIGAPDKAITKGHFKYSTGSRIPFHIFRLCLPYCPHF
jgi:hypothetical protein